MYFRYAALLEDENKGGENLFFNHLKIKLNENENKALKQNCLKTIRFLLVLKVCFISATKLADIFCKSIKDFSPIDPGMHCSSRAGWCHLLYENSRP